MATITVLCPLCQCDNVVKFGKSAEGKQRFRCDNKNCDTNTFILAYTYNGHKPGIREKIIDMALNASGKVLACVFGHRQDKVFLKLQCLLSPLGITNYYTDYWGTYHRHIEIDKHFPGKRCTQKIERKHLIFRTRLKRLARKTICFSKSNFIHDTIIGLFINHYEFNLKI